MYFVQRMCISNYHEKSKSRKGDCDDMVSKEQHIDEVDQEILGMTKERN